MDEILEWFKLIGMIGFILFIVAAAVDTTIRGNKTIEKNTESCKAICGLANSTFVEYSPWGKCYCVSPENIVDGSYDSNNLQIFEKFEE